LRLADLDSAIADVVSPVFVHAQLHIELSRVRGRGDIHIIPEYVQMLERAAFGEPYISVTDSSERLLLLDTFPVSEQRAAFEAQYPVPPAAAPLPDPPSEAPPPPPSHA